MTISPEVLQTYDRYLVLASMARRDFAGTLAGKLLLIPGLESQIPQFVFAAGIVGAATLVVESETSRIQEANRRRVCEFMVNTLDESVRILKNELRKHQPVAVLLRKGLVASLGEMLERGLQPDLIAVSNSESANELTAQFVARGAKMVDFDEGVELGGEQRKNGMLDITWKILEAPGLWLPKVDALFVGIFPDDSRSRWIRAAPLYLERQLQFERFVRLRREEADLFLDVLKHEVASGEIGTPIQFEIGEDGDRLVLSV